MSDESQVQGVTNTEEVDLQNLPKISESDKAKALQSTIYYLTSQEPFYGSLIQELTIKYSMQVPTAGITYNTKASQYEIYVNPYFFFSLTNKERVAVFHHEVLHFTNKHLFRLPFTNTEVSNDHKKLYNIAGDMAINQYIKGLPDGAVDVAAWKLDDGTSFPVLKNMEEYYDLIRKEDEKQRKSKNINEYGEPLDEEGDGEESEGEGKEGDKESKNGKEKGKGKSKNKPKPGTALGNVPEQIQKYRPMDEHNWEDLDEETKQRMLDDAKKILQRTIEKTSFSHSIVPAEIKDLLREIEALAAGINYKQILKNAIKRSVSSAERENTWKRPNRRYGEYSPGTQVGALPKLAFFNDSSGSISVTEQNEYLRMMDEFLKVGSRNCVLAFWHTNLYYKKNYKKGQKLTEDLFESGGTDPSCVLEDIRKNNYNLSIIFTDGYYDAPSIKPTSEIIFIISKGGNEDHPLKHLGKTIYLDKLK